MSRPPDPIPPLVGVLAAVAIGTLGAFRGDDHALTLAALGGGAVVAIFAAVGLIHQRQRAPLLGSALHPFAAATVAWWLFDGARMLNRRVPIRWGGKEYVLEPHR